LAVLRETIPSDSVDLIYLDPPFNSNVEYNILYGTRRAGPSESQSHTFDDMWRWGPAPQRALNETADRHLQAGALLDSFQRVFPKSDMMAYLAMMAVRLIELHRVLKPTGSLYLHCDPTASHYLKILLDAIFGPERFLNEITWKRTSSHNTAKRYGNVADHLLFYSKTENYTWNPQYVPFSAEQLARYKKGDDGRLYKAENLTADRANSNSGKFEWRGVTPPPTRGWGYTLGQLEKWWAEGRILTRKDGAPRMDGLKVYLDELRGQPLQSIWTDIERVGNTSRERIGYPTQKPLVLLERVINSSTNKGDIVLDPFCGCGTAIEAAEKLERKWVGIDVTYLAIHVIEGRLEKAFGPLVRQTYQLFGRPEDASDARALAARDWLEFQKWAVMVLGGLPKDKPGADGGIDGIIRYHRVGIEQPNRAVVSVKGGVHVGVDAIHKLKSVVQREKAELGVLVCLDPPTPAMIAEAASEGEVGPRSRRVSKIQIINVDMLFTADPVRLPGMLDPPEAVGSSMVRKRSKGGRKRVEGQGELLLPITGTQTPKPAKRSANRSIRPVEIEVTRPRLRTK
jgi:site-specific DNA-methyltransferase (adenine-specific)